ncbi:MAG: mechanosensitive ion channel [Atopobiaceae bacterium]|nr:mechanosensitive ion channel [Atopobiaceae bacterium]
MNATNVQEAVLDIFGFGVPVAVIKLGFLLVVAVAAFIVDRLLTRALRSVLERASVPSASIFVNIARVVVWVFALLAVLQPVFGIEPTGFVAALGVTSIALSLGMQDTIANVFGGLALMVGKVIVPGDIVTIGTLTGEVTDINWRSTTLKLFSGDMEIIPNSVLSKKELTKLAPFQAGEFRLPVMIKTDADFDRVREEIERIAREALQEFYDEEFGAPLFVEQITNFGVMAHVSLHVKPGLSPRRACTAVAKELLGKSWLA